MRLDYKDIINKHKGKPCVVALHGPSLSPHIDEIQNLQKQDKIIRISVNEWFDFFKEKPDYWVISNAELNIRDSVLNENIWKMRGYPPDVFNTQGVPLLYNRTADLTDPDFVDKNLKCDYLPFDNRHFKGHKCLDILKNFKKYHDENRNLDFRMYGNNAQMWQLPDTWGRCGRLVTLWKVLSFDAGNNYTRKITRDNWTPPTYGRWTDGRIVLCYVCCYDGV